jgi:exodeoxyribonuclease VII small subunit
MTSKKLSYSEAFKELEAILTKLENQELDVDQLSEYVKRAADLIKFCKSKLHDTEEEIEKILGEMDNDTL